MTRRPYWLYAILMVALVGCASTAVTTTVAEGLLTPVVSRTAAYTSGDDAATANLDRAVAALAALSTGEYIPALPARPHVEAVCAMHDSYVSADVTIGEVRRATYLRSTRLLRAMFRQAAQPPQ